MTVLVDTSIWIDHFRKGDSQLSVLLFAGNVCSHSMVIGELACGHLNNRSQILSLLNSLPVSTKASDDESMLFLEQNALMGKGIGWVDMHLLAATALTPNCTLWTRDKRLRDTADDLGLAFKCTAE